MNKWMLLLKSLPLVGIILAIKLVITEVFCFKGFMELSEMGIILTGGVFLMGFMLAGTMSDYKESEKLPAEIAASFEALAETYINAAASKPKVNLSDVKQSILGLYESIYGWLYKSVETKQLFNSFTSFAKNLQANESEITTSVYLKILNEMHNVRKTVGRVNYIAKTGFLSSGYALLETLIGLIGLLLMVTVFKSLFAEVVIVFFIMLIYTYMYQLNKDIDDLFEHEAGKAKGAAEVDLFPIDEYYERLKIKMN